MKKHFTEDEHLKAGALMKQAYENIQTLSIMFQKAYPKTNEVYQSLDKAKAFLLTAKDKADDLFYRENPNTKADHVYFGKRNSDK